MGRRKDQREGEVLVVIKPMEVWGPWQPVPHLPRVGGAQE